MGETRVKLGRSFSPLSQPRPSPQLLLGRKVDAGQGRPGPEMPPHPTPVSELGARSKLSLRAGCYLANGKALGMKNEAGNFHLFFCPPLHHLSIYQFVIITYRLSFCLG